MKSAVIVFPASNCDRDAQTALADITGEQPQMVWHGDSDIPDVDLIVLPGGFSYGDYLRCGAMAAHSHIMRDVKRKAEAGVAVLGICNGFQILTEAGLLPGVFPWPMAKAITLPMTKRSTASKETVACFSAMRRGRIRTERRATSRASSTKNAMCSG